MGIRFRLFSSVKSTTRLLELIFVRVLDSPSTSYMFRVDRCNIVSDAIATCLLLKPSGNLRIRYSLQGIQCFWRPNKIFPEGWCGRGSQWFGMCCKLCCLHGYPRGLAVTYTRPFHCPAFLSNSHGHRTNFSYIIYVWFCDLCFTSNPNNLRSVSQCDFVVRILPWDA